MMALAGSKDKIERVWTLHSDKQHFTDTLVLSKEMYEAIKKAHGLN